MLTFGSHFLVGFMPWFLELILDLMLGKSHATLGNHYWSSYWIRPPFPKLLTLCFMRSSNLCVSLILGIECIYYFGMLIFVVQLFPICVFPNNLSTCYGDACYSIAWHFSNSNSSCFHLNMAYYAWISLCMLLWVNMFHASFLEIISASHD